MISKKQLLLLAISFLTACINIAPDEKWDEDDIRIWVKHTSSLNLPAQSFLAQKSNMDTTVLVYKNEYESGIVDQIKSSPYFNETSDFMEGTELWNKMKERKLTGMWHEQRNGYSFLQMEGNQYPGSITIDTVKNELFIKTIRK